MIAQYKDGMIYPPMPKQTEGYNGDYWTEDDLTGYALDFWGANVSVSDTMIDRALQAISDFQQANTHIGEDVRSYRRRMLRSALEEILPDPSPSFKEHVRSAVADYMRSEGCSCCEDTQAHGEHKEVLAKLLHVQSYEDGSGYDFALYRTEK